MAASNGTTSKWLTFAITLAVAAASAISAITIHLLKKKSNDLHYKVRELEISLKASSENCIAERQGRIRAQQALRKALTQPKSDNAELTSYPMTPIAIVQSCFSTRNGTPRQPLLVPLARASLVFNKARVPPASLEGLGEYSHCWIIYVFHLNTNLEKLWKQPSKSKFKAKVRVPRLRGEKMGVFATRSPHRPSPIGLTVAKVEAVEGHMVLLSGVDLVDGTPVLDVKPYLPYCDNIQGATVPKWITGFSSTLADCWATAEKKSLYASPDELQSLIKQVLSWDIRSISQRNRTQNSNIKVGNGEVVDYTPNWHNYQDEEASEHESEQASPPSGDTIYHLTLECLNVSYRIDCNSNVVVENVTLSSDMPNSNQTRCNYRTWRDKLS